MNFNFNIFSYSIYKCMRRYLLLNIMIIKRINRVRFYTKSIADSKIKKTFCGFSFGHLVNNKPIVYFWVIIETIWCTISV